AADRAQGTTETALRTAIDAQGRAAQTTGRITPAESSARGLLAAAEQKLGQTTPGSAQGHPVGGEVMAAGAQCPPGTFIAGGGYTVTGIGTANFSEPEGNGWEAEADGPLTVRAICLER